MSLFAIAAGFVIVVAITWAIVSYLWPKIRKFYMMSVQPWLTRKFSPRTKEIIDNVFCFLNKQFSFTRQVAVEAWNLFVKKVLFYRQRWRERTNGKVEVETQVKVQNDLDDGKVDVITEVETLNWDDLPFEDKFKLYDNPDGVLQTDNLVALRQKYSDEMQTLAN